MKIKITQGNATRINREDKSYDIILLFGDSIGSILDPKDKQKVFDECYRILKDYGILITTLGNRYSSLGWAIRHSDINVEKFMNNITVG